MTLYKTAIILGLEFVRFLITFPILPHAALALLICISTAGMSTSSSVIIRPKYLNLEVFFIFFPSMKNQHVLLLVALYLASSSFALTQTRGGQVEVTQKI